MATITLEQLGERLDLADALLQGRCGMWEPEDLPGRFGRAVAAVNRVLEVFACGPLPSGPSFPACRGNLLSEKPAHTIQP